MRWPHWDIKSRNALRLFAIALGAILLRLLDGLVTRWIGAIQ